MQDFPDVMYIMHLPNRPSDNEIFVKSSNYNFTIDYVFSQSILYSLPCPDPHFRMSVLPVTSKVGAWRAMPLL